MNATKKISILSLLALAVGAIASLFYPYGFIMWNIPVYALCWAGFIIGTFFLAWAFLEVKNISKAWLIGLLIGLIYCGAVFGISAIVQTFTTEELRIPSGIVCFLFFSYFVVFFILLSVKTDAKGARSVIGGVLAVCMLFFDVVGVLIPGWLYGKGPSYLAAIYQVCKQEETTIPGEAFIRNEPDYNANKRFLVNIDETTQVADYVEYLKTKDTITESDLAYYVEPYLGTQVTDILFSVCGQSSATKSNYLTWRGDKVKWTVENGKEVDYSSISWWWYILQEQDIDPVPTWIKTCNENNIRPWLSFRMNDCHDSDKETSPLRGELFYTAKQNGWMIGEEYGYYHTCLDYSVPQIRQIMLSYIEEQLLRYDVCGIELDFQREIYCFNYLNEDNEKIVAIMNDFIRSVNAIVKGAETKWGHDIEITARLMRDIDQCKIFGFDVRTWNSEKLVDSITVTPRFSSCDSDMDIKGWKETLKNIEIYAGIETRVSADGDVKENVVSGAEVTRGYAAEYMEEGDGIYLFNYMAYSYLKRNEVIYNTCGKAESVYSSTRRHVMTYQDIAPEGQPRYQPLPAAALKNKPATLRQKTGFIPAGATVNVYIGFVNKVSSSRVTVKTNDIPCVYEGEGIIYADSEVGHAEDIPYGYLPEGSNLYRFTVSDTSSLGNVLYVTVENNRSIPLVITYLEIEIIPKN